MNPNMTDPFAFMKDLWGSMSNAIPGMVAPTLDIDELEKRITDLKAVEGWLNMNLTMLRTTIQGLELQKTGLEAFRTMSNSSQELMRAAAASATPEVKTSEPKASTSRRTSQAGKATPS